MDEKGNKELKIMEKAEVKRGHKDKGISREREQTKEDRNRRA